MPAYASSDGASLPTLGSTSLVLNKPSGTVDGDLLLVFIIISANTTITPPAGWNTTVNASGVKGYWKIASSEPASYTFTRGLSTNTIVGTIARVTGVDTSNPIDTAAALASGTGTSIAIPSVTVTSGTFLFQIAASLTSSTFTAPGTATEDYDSQYASQNFAAAGGHETVGAGATGTRTWTASASGTRSGIMWAIKPAPVSATVTVPGAASATSTAQAPGVSAGSSVAGATASATAAAAASAQSAGSTITPPSAESTASSPFAGITTSAGSTLFPPRATATADQPAPGVSAGSSVAGVLAEATADAVAPSLSAGSSLALPAATATADGHAPALSYSANVSAEPATATAEAPALEAAEETLFFDPPTQNQAMPDHFWGRFSIPVGVSVVKVSGHYTNVPTPTHDELTGVEGTDFFRGGYHYEVTTEVAADLTADGYTSLTKDAHVH